MECRCVFLDEEFLDAETIIVCVVTNSNDSLGSVSSPFPIIALEIKVRLPHARKPNFDTMF
jgi:hypothetical protein